MKSYSLGDRSDIAEYVEELFQPEDRILAEVRTRSLEKGLPPIQVCSMDARHLEVIARMVRPQKIVEIGTLGGYSGMSFLRALKPQNGKLFTFEISPVNAAVAKDSFLKAGFKENNFEIFLGPALENLNRINSQGPFDLVFIDADKVSMPMYFEWAVENLREGGVIIGDNTFAFGQVANPQGSSDTPKESVTAIRKFNEKMATDPRVKGTLFPTGEGMTVAIKV